MGRYTNWIVFRDPKTDKWFAAEDDHNKVRHQLEAKGYEIEGCPLMAKPEDAIAWVQYHRP